MSGCFLHFVILNQFVTSSQLGRIEFIVYLGPVIYYEDWLSITQVMKFISCNYFSYDRDGQLESNDILDAT
ncbi:hypothetical protein [Aliikangiella sp. IMCC44359]|uniref:hypothetical protein n=1 Tax=Aliikangiella sp. IMCC44359 TaxID=3459125 RepID=UPI00403B0498